MKTRKTQLAALASDKVFDIIIVGGGASGLGIAVDAASRGLDSVLFEWHDFAKGTSSKSTKLVHGGVRYLQQGDVKMVKEALLERGLLEKNAGHLFKRQEFIIPNYTWWGGYYYTIGLKLYDLLAQKFSLGRSTLISKKKTIAALPTLKTEGLQKGVSYYDGQFDDARLAVNLAQTARDQGALVMNHMRVVNLLSDAEGNATGVVVKDMETEAEYTVHAKVVVNAAGIFTDKVLKLKDASHKKTVVPSQGVHLVLDEEFLQSETALMIPKTSDGRVLFIIPWNGKVLAGTTDTLIKKPKIEPVALESEIEFILNTIGQYLTRVPNRDEVRSVFVGLRPLAKPKKDETNTKEVSRSHKILSEQGVVTIVGGKWTTYRKMAQDVIDTIIADYGFEQTPSQTKTLPIRGNIDSNQNNTPAHLRMYGGDLEAFLSFQTGDSAYNEVLHANYPYTQGQVAWAVREEMARSVEDVLARRVRLLFLDARAAIEAAPKVAEILAKELQKDSEWEKSQLESFNKLANQYLLN
ncbi:glycerol-3-phosphate dehydrogenase/oxidase [Gilvibacter sediminis]|uniref:glycerol-3-phosphate dehydrogenase/oxidase n=1 Tax=Gilvibacter sediminis TaxID=379071 RepID=UPI002350CBFF|nr:glycerol-3-phosphate dehydrogenase/oxidase [Gilvibacter sediminis]MDC7997134.1 glycerol-3-phosphate dehydrogenase/oxidase [Gilvibacter sediminis]